MENKTLYKQCKYIQKSPDIQTPYSTKKRSGPLSQLLIRVMSPECFGYHHRWNLQMNYLISESPSKRKV